MKKVLFVIHRIGVGGSITSLLNLLEMLNDRGDRCDLFIMEHEGVFLERAKRVSNVLAEDKALASMLCDKSLLKQKYGLAGVWRRGVIHLKNKLFSSGDHRQEIYKRAAAKLDGYDAVVAYQENTTTEFTRYINAGKKIAWVHTMYDRFSVGYTKEEMLGVYENYGTVVCVAEASADSFGSALPELEDRVKVIPNPLNEKLIIEKSMLEGACVLPEDKKILVSVGRLSPEKQYEYIMDAAASMRDRRIDFVWYLIGGGTEKDKLEAIRAEKQLEDRVIMTGMLDNPYPIIKGADILVISSLYEAQPMVANEALILDVPVITTKYPSAATVITNGENGAICENSSAALTDAIISVITDTEEYARLKAGAEAFEYNSARVVDKIAEECGISR